MIHSFIRNFDRANFPAASATFAALGFQTVRTTNVSTCCALTIHRNTATVLSLGSKVQALEATKPQLSQDKTNNNNNPAEVNLVNVSPEGDEWISSPGYDQRMVGNVLLLVTRGFEFILYTLLLVTGVIHSTLVMFVFLRCCRPSFTRKSPLRSREGIFKAQFE